jgi:hypothetical protein
MKELVHAVAPLFSVLYAVDLIMFAVAITIQYIKENKK